MAYKAVAEYGLNQTIRPVSLATLSGGGLDDAGGAVPWARDQGHLVDLVQKEVKVLLQSVLEVALSVVRANPSMVEALGAQLEASLQVFAWKQVDGFSFLHSLILRGFPETWLTTILKGPFRVMSVSV